MENKKNNIILENINNEFIFNENKSNLNILFNRIAFIFFCFIFLCFVYSIQIFHLINKEIKKSNNSNLNLSKNHRADIIDLNGQIIAKTILRSVVGIKPNLIIDEKKLLLNLKIILPDLNLKSIKKKIKAKKFFWLSKKLDQKKINQLRLLGDKSIIFEKQVSRIYPQKSLFSHIVGQIDDDNKGISGIEKSFDFELRKDDIPLQLTLDTNIQFLIRKELIKFQKIFKNIGSASILMDINTGEIISMVSLPDFDLNKRQDIYDSSYINRATKGLYEFGSVFKTFTLAGALNEGIVETNTEFKNLPKKITCAGRPIGEYDDKIPPDLTAEEILIRSGNIGSVRIAQRFGREGMKDFLNSIGVLNKIDFDIEEVGEPISFRWGKCKLATASFGHGITTTLLQVAKGYSIISNGGFEIKPTLVKKEKKEDKKIRILKEGVSREINSILRKIVSSKEGTANFANVQGYEVGGKTGTAQKSFNGVYSKNKINTFAAIFPISKPKYILLVLLDEPKPSKDYIYHYRDGSGWKYKGTPFNTAGWTSVEIAGKIIEKIGPILAINKIDFYDNHVVKKSN